MYNYILNKFENFDIVGFLGKYELKYWLVSIWVYY